MYRLTTLIIIMLSLMGCSQQEEKYPGSGLFEYYVTKSPDVSVIEVVDEGTFREPGIFAHFHTTPETLSSIIEEKKLKPVSPDSLKSTWYDEILPAERWTRDPKEVSFYKYEEHIRNKHTGKYFLNEVIMMQHNEEKNEVFYRYSAF